MSNRSVEGFYFVAAFFYFLLSARSSQIRIPLPGYKETIKVFMTQRCPKTESEWRAVSNQMNCSIDNDPPVNQYHCLPTPKRNMLVEFCYNEYSKMTEHGNCLELGGRGYLNYVNCKGFIKGCPNKDYKSEEIFKYPACLQIDVERGCFLAEEDCKLTSSSTTEPTTRSGDTFPSEYIVILVPAATLCFIFALILYLKKRRHQSLPTPESESREETHSTDTSNSCKSEQHFKTSTEKLNDRKKYPEDHRKLLTMDNMEKKILSIKVTNSVSKFGEKTTITGKVNSNFQIQGLEWQTVSKRSKKFERISIDNSKYIGSIIDPSKPCLVINDTKLDDAIKYRLVGYLADERITSNDVEVSVLGDIPHPKLKRKYEGYEDNEVTIYGDLNSFPSPSSVKWLFCKEEFGEYTEIEIKEKGFQEFIDDKHAGLVKNLARSSDGGFYKMVVSNELGEGISKPAFLSIKEDIERTSESLSFPSVLPTQRNHTNTQGT
ncbi:uncharacterized protein LOC134240084 [Saccostrea cucullata]|uniref:uncharacterized protein LOC134240084 n=1 Tax=Saccostrea cuccullata TaxID=36930 RepID=UPI002ED18083